MFGYFGKFSKGSLFLTVMEYTFLKRKNIAPKCQNCISGGETISDITMVGGLPKGQCI